MRDREVREEGGPRTADEEAKPLPAFLLESHLMRFTSSTSTPRFLDSLSRVNLHRVLSSQERRSSDAAATVQCGGFTFHALPYEKRRFSRFWVVCLQQQGTRMNPSATPFSLSLHLLQQSQQHVLPQRDCYHRNIYILYIYNTASTESSTQAETETTLP